MICRICGHDERWCKIYTGCPLNKGKEHQMDQKKFYRPVRVFRGVDSDKLMYYYNGEFQEVPLNQEFGGFGFLVGEMWYRVFDGDDIRSILENEVKIKGENE